MDLWLSSYRLDLSGLWTGYGHGLTWTLVILADKIGLLYSNTQDNSISTLQSLFPSLQCIISLTSPSIRESFMCFTWEFRISAFPDVSELWIFLETTIKRPGGLIIIKCWLIRYQKPVSFFESLSVCLVLASMGAFHSLSRSDEMPDRERLEITIVGAGLSGIAAAISCASFGHRVKVIEQAKELAEVSHSPPSPHEPSTQTYTY